MSSAVPVSFIGMRIFVHATEDPDKVMDATRNILTTAYSDEILFTKDNLKGYYGNPITLLKTEIRKKPIIKAFVETIASKLSEEGKNTLLTSIERHVDESGNLYLRLDKQAAFCGRLEPTYEDPIRIQLRLNLRQKSTDKIVELCRSIGIVP